jgi:hypothetical protein
LLPMRWCSRSAKVAGWSRACAGGDRGERRWAPGDPRGAGHELLRELLLIDMSRHGLDRLGHYWSIPAKPTSSRVGQLHRYADTPIASGSGPLEATAPRVRVRHCVGRGQARSTRFGTGM